MHQQVARTVNQIRPRDGGGRLVPIQLLHGRHERTPRSGKKRNGRSNLAGEIGIWPTREPGGPRADDSIVDPARSDRPAVRRPFPCQDTVALAYVAKHGAWTPHERRRGREAEGDGLLNRYRGNPIVGSNPTVSARFQ